MPELIYIQVLSVTPDPLAGGQQAAISCANANALGASSGRVFICPTDDPGDPDFVEQTVLSWADESILFTAVRGALTPGVPVYLFVLNTEGVYGVTSTPVEFSPPGSAPMLSWTEGATPGLWKEYRLYRRPAQVPGSPQAPDQLLATTVIDRDWAGGILLDIREHIDTDIPAGTECSYYVVAVDHNSNSVQSAPVSIQAVDWPPPPGG